MALSKARTALPRLTTAMAVGPNLTLKDATSIPTDATSIPTDLHAAKTIGASCPSDKIKASLTAPKRPREVLALPCKAVLFQLKISRITAMYSRVGAPGVRIPGHGVVHNWLPKRRAASISFTGRND